MEKILVSTVNEGVAQAKKILYQNIDRKTALFLSGGKSPKPLYQELALEKKLHPAAVALVDERYGKPMHDASNEKMIRRTGLLTYFASQQIPYYPILQDTLSREETAERYDETVRKLFFNIPRSVAIMSLGTDGHTAGLPSRISNFQFPISNVKLEIYNTYDLVTEYHDTERAYGERITVTFQGLSLMDKIILWVFGEEKRPALEKMFIPGSLEEIPGRFYTKPEIAKKTVLITDIE